MSIFTRELSPVPGVAEGSHDQVRLSESRTIDNLDRSRELGAWLKAETTPVFLDLVPGLEVPAEGPLPEFAQLYATIERITESGGPEDQNEDGMVVPQALVLGITSAVAGEGKTTVALQLALSARANTFKRICLIDLSLGGEDLCRHLGAGSPDVGVMEFLEGSLTGVPRLSVGGSDQFVIIPAGRTPANPARSARNPRVAELIAAIREAYDLIIVDLPSVVSDNVAPLVRHLDGVLMVACTGITPVDVIKAASDRVGVDKILGLVLNRHRPARFGRRFSRK